MYFSRIRFKAGITPDKAWIVDNLYQSHRTIWRLFPSKDGDKRDHLFRKIDSNNDQLEFYIISPDKPMDENNYWNIETKPYKPVIAENDEFLFSLRVNPVITKTNSETGKKARHDVVMNKKQEWRKEHGQNPNGVDFQQLIHDAGVKWLTARCEPNGFRITQEKIVVSGYLQHKLNKKQTKTDFSKYGDKKEPTQSTEIKFSTLDFEGVLKVIDPAKFKNCMFQGIGPSKAFGCGLMLLKRV